LVIIAQVIHATSAALAEGRDDHVELKRSRAAGLVARAIRQASGQPLTSDPLAVPPFVAPTSRTKLIGFLRAGKTGAHPVALPKSRIVIAR
jgi:hypothetical protein